uniref:Large ribosomal subunit protein eL33 n=1 Tax=Lygus hesperus TaxID=30085 RepID=A0A0A9WTV5_LYGHE
MAPKSEKKPTKKPSRLYAHGVFASYAGTRELRKNHIALIKIEGVKDISDTSFYLGKRLAYVYKVKSKKGGHSVRTIWGRVTRPHGNNGLVRGRFDSNLPSKALGKHIRVMLYPSNI